MNNEEAGEVVRKMQVGGPCTYTYVNMLERRHHGLRGLQVAHSHLAHPP